MGPGIQPSVHASAVLVGAKAVLVRGPSGSGKSLLARRLLALGGSDPSVFVRLVADDRVHLTALGGRLVARAPRAIEGLIEARGLGIADTAFEASAVVGLVVDLAEPGAGRMPEPADLAVEIHGLTLPRLPVAPGVDPLPLVVARTPWCRSLAAVLAASHAGQYR